MKDRTFPDHVLITGAGGSLGRELSLELAAMGSHLSLCDINGEQLEEVLGMARISDFLVASARVDTADSDAMEAFITQADASRPIDWVIAGAGITEPRPMDPFTLSTGVMEVNFTGVLNTVFPAIRAMVKRGRGHVVLISSMASFLGFPRVPQYAASKAAVRVFGRSLRYWLRREGIGLTIACPGFFPSGMSHNDQPRPGGLDAMTAAHKIILGVLKHKNQLVFPRSQGLILKLLSILPVSLQDRFFERVLKRE
ncbi:MAG: SDR family NAD(P)-dependent oxidoreductase [Desulfobacterales bacterium]|nr:SDR family NAD(P)-dependent oxidoreductase [Desulfobacterales bacterium]